MFYVSDVVFQKRRKSRKGIFDFFLNRSLLKNCSKPSVHEAKRAVFMHIIDVNILY